MRDTAVDKSSTSAGWVELAKRAASGLEVALLWNRSSNRVKVAVSDDRVCHYLDFEVARADALDAFYHPFAYATSHLDDTRRAAFVSGPAPDDEHR
jgi:hypothetical protein